ncbi:MAG: PQQ-dependent sugar dehydrogenase [Acidimicrobiales bacterium]
MARHALIALAMLGLGLSACTATQPTPVDGNFAVETVFGGLALPTAVRFAPNGHVFVAEREGVVKRFDSLSDGAPTVVIDLQNEVSVMWDRGLLGLAVDPAYASGRPYIYVLYSLDAPPGGTAPAWPGGCIFGGFGNNGVCGITTGRLERIEVGPDGHAVGRTPLITDWCMQFGSHSIGDLGFGPDGALYASGGEGASFNDVDRGQFGGNPCDDPPLEGGMLRSQDVRTTDDPTTLDGTVIRIDPDTGAAWPTNPWAGDPDPNRARVVAYGLRNPYRFGFDPAGSELVVGDVGWSEWEELNRMGLDEATPPNFGWPCYEGINRQPFVDAASLPLCTTLADEDVRPPILAYGHSTSLAPECASGGTSVTGVAVSRGNAYPMNYRQGIFMADYSRKCIVFFPRTEDGTYDFTAPRLLATAAPVSDLTFGPGGYLYFTNLIAGVVQRIVPTGDDHAPVPVIGTDATWGPLPLTVQLDGSATTDPDPGNILSYRWDLDDDGQFDDATTISTPVTFTTAGPHRVRLRVNDSMGAGAVAEVIIWAGNSPPAPVIDLPSTASANPGELVDFAGHADDGEDGPLAASALVWTFAVQHCDEPGSCHEHLVGSAEGVDQGQFQMPDHDPPAYLEVRLTATDSMGMTATAHTTMEIVRP